MKKLFAAVAVAFALLIVSATSAMASDIPDIQLAASDIHAHSIDLTYVADPMGDASNFYVEYFKKTFTTDCSTPDPMDYAFFQTSELGSIDSDLDDMHFVSPTISGLTKSSAYCVHAVIYNSNGTFNSPFYEFGTPAAPPTPATITPLVVSEPDEDAVEGTDAQLKFIMSDQEAASEVGGPNSFQVEVRRLDSDQCNEDGYLGGDEIIHGLWTEFSGDLGQKIDLQGLQLGETYCAAVHVYSAWGGGGYDATSFRSFTFGHAPSFSDVSSSSDTSSITLSATLSATHLVTSFDAEYFAKVGPSSCAAQVDDPAANDAAATSDTADPSAIETTIADLDPGTDYCVRLTASNDMGDASSDWLVVSTASVGDHEAPSTPTGLVASNVAQTSATISWTAATDNVGVTGYKIYKNIVFVGDASGTSATVSVNCGQSALFAVKAVDAAGNLSTGSLPVQIIGAACDVPAPPAPPASGGGGGGQTAQQPAAQKCLSPIKTQTDSGKFKKGKKKVKYSVKVTGKVAGDGQSAVITVKDDGVTAAFAVDGKSVKAKNGSITVKKSAALVTVSYKAGSSTKTLKLKLAQVTC